MVLGALKRRYPAITSRPLSHEELDRLMVTPWSFRACWVCGLRLHADGAFFVAYRKRSPKMNVENVSRDVILGDTKSQRSAIVSSETGRLWAIS